MSAEALALALAIASVVALVVVVIAFREPLRQAAKENSQPRSYWPLVAFSAGVALVFQLINALVD